MRAGLLSERVTLQAKSVTRDSLGAEIVTWADVATVWAGVDAITGREVHAAQQLHAEVTKRVQIRYRDGITAGHRALHRGQVMAVHAVLPSRNREYLTLLCSEGVSDG